MPRPAQRRIPPRRPARGRVGRGTVPPAENQPLRLSAAESYPCEEADYLTVPTRWVKFVIGVFLLPVAWILTETFFTLLTRATIDHRFWAAEEFWFFSLGAVLWLIVFFGLPRPVVIYVFGHELTHAIWVWLMGGRVSKFQVTREGGQILTNKTNFLIALAPYFFPIYSLLVIAVFGAFNVFYDLVPLHRWLYAAIGLTWCFHFTFTCWVIPKGQSDLTDHGTFFSLLVVFLFNVALLLMFLVAASPTIGWMQAGQELLDNSVAFSRWAADVARAIAGQR